MHRTWAIIEREMRRFSKSPMNTGWDAIAYDLGFLMVFSVVAMTAATALFKRTL
jgi:hypothetical protein